MKESKQKKQKSLARNIVEWILVFVVAFAIALPARMFVFTMARVDGTSMNDTLNNGEIMFVTKLDYGAAWLCFPWQTAEQKEKATRITVGGDPQRFDVVICRYPDRGDTNFVKRIVGIPGDVVELKAGTLYVNGQEYEEPYVSDEYRGGFSNTFGPYTVPEGHYFVMGDHRNNSNDSRFLGAISRDMIVGHVRTILFPFNVIRGVK